MILKNPVNYPIIKRHIPELAAAAAAAVAAHGALHGESQRAHGVTTVRFMKRKRASKSADTVIHTMHLLNVILKEILLEHLKNDVVARISKTEYGVGVAAFRKIRNGQFPFTTPAGPCINYHTVRITPDEAAAIDPAMKELLADFFLNPHGNYPMPIMGPNSIDLGFYLNHSDTPNLDIRFLENCDLSIYVANRDIEPGEQLTINYCKFGFRKDVIEKQMPFLKDKCNAKK